jgi:hypothetical protein
MYNIESLLYNAKSDYIRSKDSDLRNYIETARSKGFNQVYLPELSEQVLGYESNHYDAIKAPLCAYLDQIGYGLDQFLKEYVIL